MKSIALLPGWSSFARFGLRCQFGSMTETRCQPIAPLLFERHYRTWAETKTLSLTRQSDRRKKLEKAISVCWCWNSRLDKSILPLTIQVGSFSAELSVHLLLLYRGSIPTDILGTSRASSYMLFSKIWSESIVQSKPPDLLEVGIPSLFIPHLNTAFDQPSWTSVSHHWERVESWELRTADCEIRLLLLPSLPLVFSPWAIRGRHHFTPCSSLLKLLATASSYWQAIENCDERVARKSRINGTIRGRLQNMRTACVVGESVRKRMPASYGVKFDRYLLTKITLNPRITRERCILVWEQLLKAQKEWDREALFELVWYG